MNDKSPLIYEYNDFRKFIADYQTARHEQDPSYTKSLMSKLLGLPNSRSYMSHILKGKKVSDTFVERFIRLFAFTRAEASFFRVLVKFNQAENPGERELYFEQLIALNKTPKKYIYETSFRYYKHWYNAAIRALLNVYDFDGKNFPILAQKLAPPITVPQTKRAFHLLLELGLVEKNTKGFFKPTSRSISSEEFVKNEALKQFQMQSLELAKYAVVNDSKRPKLLTTNTISVSKRGCERIEKLIDRFRAQVRSLVHKDEDQADTIYQIDVLFFPMMK
jgi:uncharacterized protein (TIGR02147 family)